MKMLSLYIESFGKLKDYSYDFSNTLNSFYQENGWGKTTLTVFIKSMLYGLNNEDRIKYTPWKSLSSFGGLLIIEAKNKKYRIERQFNPKDKELDSFHIYDIDLGKELKNIDSNVGEKFLNLNSTSFERSVFIPEEKIDGGFGSDIEAKLANLIGGTNDSESFDKACEILSNRMNQIKLNNKKGIICDKKKKMAAIESEIDDCIAKVAGISLIQEDLEIKNKELIKLNEKKRTISNQIINYSKSQDMQAKYAVLKKYEDDVKATKEKLNSNNEIFNGNSLTQEDLLSVKNQYKKLTSLKTAAEFEKEKNINVYERLQQLEETLSKYDLPTSIDIANISKKIEKLNNIKGVLSAHEEEPVHHKPVLGISFTIVSSIILLVGVGLFVYSFFSSYKDNFLLSGICVMVAATLGYVLSIAFFLINANKNQPKFNDKVKSYDYELRSTEEEIRAFFFKYHLYSNDYTNNLFIVRSNVQKYTELKAEYDLIDHEGGNREKKIEELTKEINLFLAKFKTTALTIEERIGELNTHLRNKLDIENNLNLKINYINKYIIENKLNNNNKFEAVDINQLNSEIERIDNEIAIINEEKTKDANEIIEFEVDVEKLDELKCNYEELKKEVDALENEYRILELSIKYLTNSQNALLKRYVQPMKDSVNKYVNQIFKNIDYNIDTSFKFQFSTEDGLKDLTNFSRGLQSIISICMRFALIDCLYPNEKPFIILDDPFVSFDDEKLRLGKKIIKDISSKYQIIYFTCHKSRQILMDKN